ncbi:MAG: addiction module protein [Pseudomonadota bacterium]|nr:addiction module protein [Pseudomonadota bacterium]
MSTTFDHLEAQVLALPAEQRQHLLNQLIASLDRDAEWALAWDAECERREAAMARDGDAWLDGGAVVAKLRAEPC